MRRKLGWALIILGIAAIVGGVLLFFNLKNRGATASTVSSQLALPKTEVLQQLESPIGSISVTTIMRG